MKILIAGATGALGRRLIARLRAGGHVVLGLARGPRGKQIVRSLGGESCPGDLFDVELLARAADGAEVVIHAAPAISSNPRVSAKEWEMNDRICRQGTRAFLATALANQSGIWHLLDDHLTTPEEFLSAMAERLGAPAPRRVPVWLAQMIADSYSVRFLLSSTRTSNRRFRSDLGWAPRLPSYREGLDQVVAAWEAEGWLEKGGKG